MKAARRVAAFFVIFPFEQSKKTTIFQKIFKPILT
jgi:hypothetical protein